MKNHPHPPTLQTHKNAGANVTPQKYTAKFEKAGKGTPSCHKQEELNARAIGQEAQVCRTGHRPLDLGAEPFTSVWGEERGHCLAQKGRRN